jgi:acyl-CoA synthetase (NDP forming)
MQRIMESQGISLEDIDKLSAAVAEEIAKRAAGLAASHAKPVIGFTYQGPEMPIIHKLLASGIPVLPSPERGVRAMAALARYGELTAKLAPRK